MHRPLHTPSLIPQKPREYIVQIFGERVAQSSPKERDDGHFRFGLVSLVLDFNLHIIQLGVNGGIPSLQCFVFTAE